MTRGTPLYGRMKVAAGTAVEGCGGVDGAAATTARGRSTCGRWLNANESDLPTLDSAVAMDKAILARGMEPPIFAAYARELHHIVVPQPTVRRGAVDWHERAARLAEEQSDLLTGLLRDIADRKIVRSEAANRRVDIAALMTVLAEIDLELVAIEEGE